MLGTQSTFLQGTPIRGTKAIVIALSMRLIMPEPVKSVDYPEPKLRTDRRMTAFGKCERRPVRLGWVESGTSAFRKAAPKAALHTQCERRPSHLGGEPHFRRQEDNRLSVCKIL